MRPSPTATLQRGLRRAEMVVVRARALLRGATHVPRLASLGRALYQQTRGCGSPLLQCIIHPARHSPEDRAKHRHEPSPHSQELVPIFTRREIWGYMSHSKLRPLLAAYSQHPELTGSVRGWTLGRGCVEDAPGQAPSREPPRASTSHNGNSRKFVCMVMQIPKNPELRYLLSRPRGPSGLEVGLEVHR